MLIGVTVLQGSLWFLCGFFVVPLWILCGSFVDSLWISMLSNLCDLCENDNMEMTLW